jgi:hypothetical protein
MVAFSFIFFARVTVAQVFWRKRADKKRLRVSAGIFALLRESAGRNREILVQNKVDGSWEQNPQIKEDIWKAES